MVLGSLVAWWTLGSSDATATSFDASFVAAAVATPLLLALTIGLRWWLVRLEDDTILPRVVHAVTCLAFIASFVTAPLVLVAEAAAGSVG